MPDKPPSTPVVIQEFAGLVTNRGLLFGPPGAAEIQVNLQSEREGALTVRPGVREVTFDN